MSELGTQRLLKAVFGDENDMPTEVPAPLASAVLYDENGAQVAEMRFVRETDSSFTVQYGVELQDETHLNQKTVHAVVVLDDDSSIDMLTTILVAGFETDGGWK